MLTTYVPTYTTFDLGTWCFFGVAKVVTQAVAEVAGLFMCFRIVVLLMMSILRYLKKDGTHGHSLLLKPQTSIEKAVNVAVLATMRDIEKKENKEVSASFIAKRFKPK